MTQEQIFGVALDTLNLTHISPPKTDLSILIHNTSDWLLITELL